MNVDDRFEVDDIFHFRDGRTIFAGTTGRLRFLTPGRVEVVFDGRECGTLLIIGEELPNFAVPPPEPRRRAISTHDPVHLDRAAIEGGRLTLRFNTEGRDQEIPMHRHLLGLDSPPRDYVAEPMTLGPNLPESWDGDAWVGPAKAGYFLRAWNKGQGRAAYGEGPSFEDALGRLLDSVGTGSRQVEFIIRQSQPA